MPLNDSFAMEPLPSAGDPDVARAYYKSPRQTIIQLSKESGLDLDDIASLAGVPVADVQAYAQKIPPAALRPKSQGELRARRPGFGHFVEDLTGSLKAGQIADKIIDYGSEPARSQVRMAQEGGENIAAGIMERNPLRIAGGAVQTGLTALPLSSRVSGALYATLPRAAGTGLAFGAAQLAGAGALSRTGEAQEATEPARADPNALKNLYQQRTTLMQRREDASAEKARQEKTGRGTRWRAAGDEIKKIDRELSGLDQMIKFEQHKSSPEYRMKLDKDRKEQERADKLLESQTPFREKYPEFTNLLVLAGVSLSAGVPFALRALKPLMSWLPGSYASRVARATKEAEKALRGNDRIGAEMRMRELDNLIAMEPALWKKAAGSAFHAGGAAFAGGALTAEASMIPDQYDAYNLPEGPEKDRARAASLNPQNYLERGVMGTLTGLSGYKIGGIIPGRTANVARGKAAADTVRSSLPFDNAMGSAGPLLAHEQMKRSLAAKKGWANKKRRERRSRQKTP